MKIILFMSIFLTVCHTTLFGMDAYEESNIFDEEQASFHGTTITVGKKQIYTLITPIREFAPLLANLIENRNDPTDPIIIQDYSQKELAEHLGTMIHIINSAARILRPNPDSQEGSYKELQLKVLAHNIGGRKALKLMFLGQTVRVDQRIIDALSLQVAHSRCIGEILRFLEQKNGILRKSIIKQYYLHNQKMPEGTDDREKGNLTFSITDALIHGHHVNLEKNFRCRVGA